MKNPSHNILYVTLKDYIGEKKNQAIAWIKSFDKNKKQKHFNRRMGTYVLQLMQE